MAKWYQRADKGLHKIVESVMKQHHRALHDAGVKVDVIFIDSDSDHALKLRGRPCLATVGILSLKDRAMGRGDAEITIDKTSYAGWGPEELRAVIDHELTHLVPKIDKKSGKVARDDLDRPKLCMRMHDYEFGWFEETVQRYGAASAEYKQAQQLLATARWMQPMLPGIESASDQRRESGSDAA